jgi:hypothetical protein
MRLNFVRWFRLKAIGYGVYLNNVLFAEKQLLTSNNYLCLYDQKS